MLRVAPNPLGSDCVVFIYLCTVGALPQEGGKWTGVRGGGGGTFSFPQGRRTPAGVVEGCRSRWRGGVVGRYGWKAERSAEAECKGNDGESSSMDKANINICNKTYREAINTNKETAHIEVIKRKYYRAETNSGYEEGRRANPVWKRTRVKVE